MGNLETVIVNTLGIAEAEVADDSLPRFARGSQRAIDPRARADFEEVACLLLYGASPTPDALAALQRSLRTQRAIPEPIVGLLRSLADAHPMDAVRSAVSALATHDRERHDDSPQATLRKGVRLIARMPTLVATFHALREGERPRRPRADLDPAADFLYQLFGYEPDDADRGALDADFILQADRGADASAFAARVVVGTGGDLHAAINEAMAAFGDK